jgi:hypothetical protein
VDNERKRDRLTELLYIYIHNSPNTRYPMEERNAKEEEEEEEEEEDAMEREARKY